MKPSLSQLSTQTRRQVRESVRGRVKTFVYSSAPVTVAAISGAVLGVPSAAVIINIDGDSHFVCSGLTGSYVIQSTGLATNPFLHAEPQIQLIDQGSGATLFDKPLRWYLVVGTGENDFPFDPPYLMRSRSAIEVQFQNPETVAYTCQLSFVGYKVYLR